MAGPVRADGENKPKGPESKRGIAQEKKAGEAAAGKPMTPQERLELAGMVGPENRGMVYGPKPGEGGMYFTSGTVAEDYAAMTNPWGPVYNVWQSKEEAKASFGNLPANQQDIFARLAAARGKSSTATGEYDRYIDRAGLLSKQGQRKTPVELAYEDALKKGLLEPGYTPPTTSEGGAGGRYTGPRASTALANEDDLRRTADALGAELLGRAVTDDEFQRALKKVRSAEMQQPTITTGGAASTVTQSGISAEGRQDIMRDILAKGPEAEEFTKATKVVDWFNQWLERRAG
jgi:hypothetical protein